MNELSDGVVAANPYAAPAADYRPRASEPVDMDLATAGQRLITLIIDYIGMSLTMGAMFALARPDGTELGLFFVYINLVSFGVPVGYYLGFEAAFGRTPGKLLVGTRVVNTQGQPASFMQLLGRTAARFVPFDVFSFLNKSGVGWHDRWSNTRVIRTR